jgi:phosphate transport system protein
MTELDQKLAHLETALIEALQDASDALTHVADSLQSTDAQSLSMISAASDRLRSASHNADSSLIRVTSQQTPGREEVRLVLALVQLAQHGVLISNQFGLIVEQLEELPTSTVDHSGTDVAIGQMAELAGEQLEAAVRAFTERDQHLAHRIDLQDDELDQLNREVFQSVVEHDADPDERELAMRHVLIARSLERIGDNAVDIAEQAAFLISGQLTEFTDASQPRVRRRRS